VGALSRKDRQACFEVLEHPADVGFIAYGQTLKELFANAALAMMSLAYELDGVEERERRELTAEGGGTDALLYSWLAEVLAVADAEHLVFRRFVVTELNAGRVRGVAHGEKFDKARHHAGTYVKAVTLHQFRVERSGKAWSARVFLDV
jgi:SHS2 domain-containing protein